MYRDDVTTTTQTRKIRPLTRSFGTDVSQVDLRSFDDGPALLALLDERLVLVFRDQHLTHAEQSRIARLMGEVTPAHPVVPGHPDFPEILELNAQQGGKNARWHTDVTFVASPPAASVLVAEVVPEFGGDTLWADARAAFSALSPALQDALSRLEAVHRISPLAHWGEPFDTALSREDAQTLFDDALKVPPVVHPVVRIHPTTAKPALFVNLSFTTHIVGVSRIESDGLLRLLFEHMVQPDFTLRHHWQPGDVVMWDNRATLHYATDDYGLAERRMRRITLRGTPALGPSFQESRVTNDPLLGAR